MRSRIVVVVRRAVELVVATVVMLGIGTASGEAIAAPLVTAAPLIRPQAAPAAGDHQQPNDGAASSQAGVGLEDGIGGAVGIVAVSLGIGGMALGVYRRRRGLATQAEANQRR